MKTPVNKTYVVMRHNNTDDIDVVFNNFDEADVTQIMLNTRRESAEYKVVPLSDILTQPDAEKVNDWVLSMQAYTWTASELGAAYAVAMTLGNTPLANRLRSMLDARIAQNV